MSAHAPEIVDLLIRGASAVATCAPGGRAPSAPARGEELRNAQMIYNGAVAISGEKIVAIGAAHEFDARFKASRVLDARGGIVIPGLVDAHTHPVFVNGREDDFERKTRGETYQQIAAAGGGILSSVRGVRAAGDAELAEKVKLRFERLLDLGTTSVEAKSGYGLTAEDELRSLRAIARAAEKSNMTVVATLLAAHAIPPEFKNDRNAYIKLIKDEIAPAAAKAGLAAFHDVFVDEGFFTIAEARELLEAGAAIGLLPKMHADELGTTGAAELAVELRAASADHLDHISRNGMLKIAGSDTIAVLLPGVSHYLRSKTDAPARALIEAGAAVAVATDYNPGTCPTPSLFEAMHLAAIRMRLSPVEALVAATRNAAFAIGMGGRRGALAPGMRADAVICDVPDVRDVVYTFGRAPVRAVVSNGVVVREFDNGRPAHV
ncbi:MAG: imidazolonepropionase [Planctomycetes bacterium]|nr:imidazolonepropionase [Planctomycetota bacterium]